VVNTPRDLFTQLSWPIDAGTSHNLLIRFGEGDPPFVAATGRVYAVLHIRDKKDEPAWSIWITDDRPGRAGGFEVWEGAIRSCSLELPSFASLGAFPAWMKAVRAVLGAPLSTVLIDAGRHKKVEPLIAKWLDWDRAVLASELAAAKKQQSLLEWAAEPVPNIRSAKDFKDAPKLLARALEREGSALSSTQAQAVAARIAAEPHLFLTAALNTELSPALCDALGSALDSSFFVPPLQAQLYAQALKLRLLEELRAYQRAMKPGMLRLSQLLARAADLPSTPAFAEAARLSCMGYAPPRSTPSLDNADASVLLIVAKAGGAGAGDALRRVASLGGDSYARGVTHIAATFGLAI
jgi:hypothetical protein